MGSRTQALGEKLELRIELNEDEKEVEGVFVPVRAIKSFDRLAVELFDCALVALADSILSSGVSVEGVHCLRDTALGGCESCCGVSISDRRERERVCVELQVKHLLTAN
jgi:hypothetical protein